MLPLEWLVGSPFTNYLVPAMTLGLIGIGAFASAGLLAFGESRGATLAVLVGAAMMVFEVVETLVVGLDVWLYALRLGPPPAAASPSQMPRPSARWRVYRFRYGCNRSTSPSVWYWSRSGRASVARTTPAAGTADPPSAAAGAAQATFAATSAALSDAHGSMNVRSRVAARSRLLAVSVDVAHELTGGVQLVAGECPESLAEPALLTWPTAHWPQHPAPTSRAHHLECIPRSCLEICSQTWRLGHPPSVYDPFG